MLLKRYGVYYLVQHQVVTLTSVQQQLPCPRPRLLTQSNQHLTHINTATVIPQVELVVPYIID